MTTRMPGKRHARFGDVGRQHDAALVIGRRRERGVLFGQRQIAVQRQHVDAGDVGQHGFRAIDLAASGEKHEHVAGLRAQRGFDRAAQLERPFLVESRRGMFDLHRKTAALRW